MKTDYEDVWDWRVENDNKPLWTRSPKEVAEADYNDFFKQVRGAYIVDEHAAALGGLAHCCACLQLNSGHW